MSFPKYADYTESQLEYIGPIPSNWDLVPFFSRFIERKESNKGMKNDNLLSLSYGHIIPKDINALDGLLPASYETYQVVHPGDLVFRLTDLQNDKRSLRSAIVTDEGIITSAYLAVRPKAMNPDFANHLFRCYDQLKVFYSMGGGLRQSMKYDDMKWLPVVSPSLPEQTQIARFLDHETAKIDALIAEQKRLIKLLQEKRQAVISHAVTKGLDPNVPMKDSGVEWLGEVPAHWSVSKFQYVTRVLTDYTANGSFASLKSNVSYLDEPSYARLVRLTDLRKSLENSNAVWIDKKSYEYLSKSALFGGEFLMANVGAHAGLFYQMPRDKGPASLAPNMFLAKFEDQLVCEQFMALVGQSDAVNKQLRLLATSSAAQPKLNKDDFRSVWFSFPCIDEQREIAISVGADVNKYNLMILEAEHAISLLNERRSALISAAVTGKIDVRDWQPPADESAFDEDVQKAGMEASA